MKNKTLFVVPNTTLTNWQKEAKQAFTEDVFSKCLFVGLREKTDGLVKMGAAKDKESDLELALQNKHNKIYMTVEMFVAVMLTDHSISDYVEHLETSDAKLQEAVNAKDDEVRKGHIASAIKRLKKSMKSSSFLESMGIDSLIIDEAHMFKNAKGSNFGNRVKYLSASDNASARAENALMKAWYIRHRNDFGDGVLCLTATPITNSPQEIYSMMSLAKGEDFINNSIGIQGVDQFLEAFCDIETKADTSVDNEENEVQAFIGFKNADLLRRTFSNVANMKSADDLDNGVANIPDGLENVSAVSMTKNQRSDLDYYKFIYQTARKGEDKLLPEEMDIIYKEMEKTGMSFDLLAHPFNYMNRVSTALIDTDMAKGFTAFNYSEKDLAGVKKAVKSFNEKGLTTEQNNLLGKTQSDQIIKAVADKNDPSKVTYTLKLIATIDEGKKSVSVNTTDFTLQGKFLSLFKKESVELGAKLEPKIAALLENIKAEKKNPKGKGGKAKQIIFCDLLGAHRKIKQLLITKCGYSASKIKILNGQSVKDAGEVQDIQDGFNADGEENRFEIIIANKKAEVGINLQKGCQAIHHLTVGWTPDSIQQRNGRGVRQGNYLKSVNVYHYDANGTFDAYKRRIVNSKNDWIQSLVNGDEGNIGISTTVSQADMEAIANAGSEEDTAKIMEQLAERDRQKALDSLNRKTNTALAVLDSTKEAGKDFDSVSNYMSRLYGEAERALKYLDESHRRILEYKRKLDEIVQKETEYKQEGKPLSATDKNRKQSLEKRIATDESVLSNLSDRVRSENEELFIGFEDELTNGNACYYARRHAIHYNESEYGQEVIDNFNENKELYEESRKSEEQSVLELAKTIGLSDEIADRLINDEGGLITKGFYKPVPSDVIRWKNEYWLVKFVARAGTLSLKGLSGSIVSEYSEVSSGAFEDGEAKFFSMATDSSAAFIWQQLAEKDNKAIEQGNTSALFMNDEEFGRYVKPLINVPEMKEYTFEENGLDHYVLAITADRLSFNVLSPAQYIFLRDNYKETLDGYLDLLSSRNAGIEYDNQGKMKYNPLAVIEIKVSTDRYRFLSGFVLPRSANRALTGNLLDTFGPDILSLPQFGGGYFTESRKISDFMATTDKEITTENIKQVLLQNAFDSWVRSGLVDNEATAKKLFSLAEDNKDEVEEVCQFIECYKAIENSVAHYIENTLVQEEQAKNGNSEGEVKYVYITGDSFGLQRSGEVKNENSIRNLVKAELSNIGLAGNEAVGWHKKGTRDKHFFSLVNDAINGSIPDKVWVLDKKAWDAILKKHRELLDEYDIEAEDLL